jgi:hypothetical protein
MRSEAMLLAFLVIAGVFVGQTPASLRAQVAAGFNGDWTLNQDKSMFEPPATRPDRRLVTLALRRNELTQTTETERTRLLEVEPFQEHSTTKVSYTAKFDGRETAVPNSLATIKLTRVNASTFERVAINAGASETSRWSLSADGKLLTVSTKGVDVEGTPYTSVQVYEKR